MPNQFSYNPSVIEPKWQDFWCNKKTFKTEEISSKPKYYILDMFPYPSGAGLHVGHPEGYTATDILSRYKRMKGFNVLHPMGWDAFGLPAEQYALQTGTHPAITTRKNIGTFKRQIMALGFSYDWDREVATCDEEYYKWTQWIFCKLYEKGLAYIDTVPVNWCPALGTVLANEEVIDGKSERGGHDVIRKPMKQWMLRITRYAESLLAGLEDLDWPPHVLEMQRNWIGRSEGARILFHIANKNSDSNSELFFEVFTTRPDTLFGATYAVLAPEHPLVDKIVSEQESDKVFAYVNNAKNKSDRARQEEANKKTGVFTGAYAIHPITGKSIPIYIADYVLITYGTGAIMAVPGHDQRDWEFAKKFGLEIITVVEGGDPSIAAFDGDGPHCNSDFLNGLDNKNAKEKMLCYLEDNNLGSRQVNYKLRDWLFSRQRYWGEPFPIIHTTSGPSLVSESELPVLLPDVERYQPTEDGEPPLANATDWVHTTDPASGKPAVRETNTMPQWAGSCWYYLRFIDPRNENSPWDSKLENYWMPVDLYVGGVEHAVLHLLYARFWHHVLHDLGLVSTREPFKRLVNQGMILGEDNQKMSKSRGNVINPDDMIREYGADTLRMYEMFMGPLEQVKPWNTKSVGGIYRFLNRVWNLLINTETGTVSALVKKDDLIPYGSIDIEKSVHRLTKKVTEDIEDLKFHTAIAALMTFLNEACECEKIPERVAKTFILLISPFAPHIAEELWSIFGETNSLAYEPWPSYDEALIIRESVTIAVQVNGKLRDTLEAPPATSNEVILSMAKDLPKIQGYLNGLIIKKEIVVPDRLVNIVVSTK
ncbi:MAG TPA: leucine--tRNA ligase [Oligoflexia bacterium]|nr:leucine--tRNA ligase [Oligoflexia bacterium]HMP48065.1 leucine--tRNA ligase [Oligoflexia bacterium]